MKIIIENSDVGREIVLTSLVDILGARGGSLTITSSVDASEMFEQHMAAHKRNSEEVELMYGKTPAGAGVRIFGTGAKKKRKYTKKADKQKPVKSKRSKESTEATKAA